MQSITKELKYARLFGFTKTRLSDHTDRKSKTRRKKKVSVRNLYTIVKTIQKTFRMFIARKTVKDGRGEELLEKQSIKVYLPTVRHSSNHKYEKSKHSRRDTESQLRISEPLPSIRRQIVMSKYHAKENIIDETSSFSEASESSIDYEPPTHKTVCFDKALPNLFSIVQIYSKNIKF